MRTNDDGDAVDLLVIGGGVFGAAAAREAALNGWSVVLCERGDLAEGTSSRSSKLLHGGLRYLERLEFGLVREALRERETTRRLAPHLARPLPFLAPMGADSRFGPLKLRAGLALYDLLARPPRGFGRSFLDAAEVRAEEPAIAIEGLRGAGRYFDFQTNDARLVAELAVAAAERGAHVRTRTEVVDLAGGPPGPFVATVRAAEPDLGPDRVRARAVIAATGPFFDLPRLGGATPPRPQARLTSGLHLVLPGRLRTHALFLTAPADGRVVFAIPFEGRTLVGTTDRDFVGDPTDPAADPADVRYLLDAANAAFSEKPFAEEDVVATFVGVRALASDAAERPSATSREQTISEEPRGVVRILGGKLTTWRPIARSLVEAAAPYVGRSLDDGTLGRTVPLPGGGPLAPDAAPRLAADFGLDAGVVARLLARYGSRAAEVLAPARDEPSLLEPIAPTIPELAAECDYAVRAEFARMAVDVLRRRTPRLLLDRVAPEDLARAEALTAARRALRRGARARR